MTREEREQALEWFKNRPITMSGAKKMYGLAISALEQSEPMDDTISKQEVLDWVIEYHKRSFELHGRYLPSQVIGWLLNDIAQCLLYKENNDE